MRDAQRRSQGRNAQPRIGRRRHVSPGSAGSRVMRRSCVLAAVTLLFAQTASAQESRIASDLRRQKEPIADACDTFSLKPLGGCGYTLFTSSPPPVAAACPTPPHGFPIG